jgi:hypothetical protein
MTNTVIFVVVSIIAGINGAVATIRHVGNKQATEERVSAPNDWMQGDTIEITTTKTVSGDTIIMKSDTTIIRWVEE